MAKPTNAEIEAKRAVIAEAREQALQAKAETDDRQKNGR